MLHLSSVQVHELAAIIIIEQVKLCIRHAYYRNLYGKMYIIMLKGMEKHVLPLLEVLAEHSLV